MQKSQYDKIQPETDNGFLPVRCPSCRRMICEIKAGSSGVLRYKCKKCGRSNRIYLQPDAEKNSIHNETAVRSLSDAALEKRGAETP